MMKKLALTFALLAMLPILAQAMPSLSWGVGGDWRVAVSTSLDLDTVGAYDFKNSQWMTGFSKDILVASKGINKVAYISGEQLFNLDEQGKGAFMMAVGIMTGSLARVGTEVVGHVIPDAKLPKWVDTAGNYVSIEGGYGRRLFGVPQGQTPHIWIIGGKVRIPIGDLRKLFKKNEEATAPDSH